MSENQPSAASLGPSAVDSEITRGGRGCVFFNFGDAYALRLLVSVFTLRRVYDGPITTFLAGDAAGIALQSQLAQLGSEVILVDRFTKSRDRHRLFLDSPYRTTLAFDSDVIFLAPIDELWPPLERDGVLVTRFYAAPYGVDGAAEQPGWGNRTSHLEQVRGLLDDATYAEARRRMLEERIDINVGVLGVSRPRGDAFLTEWAEHMERGRAARVQLMDEMLVVALSARHRHFLADEKWNCPADEFFRRTNLADARVVHYFADGFRVHGIRLGRNPATWAGRKWYDAYRQAAAQLDLARWRRRDPTFTRRLARLLSPGVGHLADLITDRVRHSQRIARKRIARVAIYRFLFPAHQAAVSVLARLGYRVGLEHPARATAIILSYKRMENIAAIVRSALMCRFVERVIVSNNNPEVDLKPYLPWRDDRLELRQQQRHRSPSYRYDLAREEPADYFICIDDDVFPSPWQLRRVFTSLLADPSSPRGIGGEVFDPRRNRLVEKKLSGRPWTGRTQPVDVIWQVYVFSRKHLDAYFELLKRLNLENEAVHSSEDVLLSFAGDGQPVLVDVGYVFECPTRNDPGIATHRRESFFKHRHHLFDLAREAAG